MIENGRAKMTALVAKFTDYVTVDWDDIPLNFAARRVARVLKENGTYGFLIRSIWGRKSANKHVHVLVELVGPVSSRYRMSIRARFGDDLKRWTWDEERRKGRHALTDYSRGVLFDRKDGKEAGPWKKLV